MTRLLQLSHQDILTLAPERIVARGWSYFIEERVQATVFLGDVIAARVIGRERDYSTRIQEHGASIASICNCPYDGPVCKHSIALLFQWARRREEFLDLRGALETLAGLGAEPLYGLFRALAGRDWGTLAEAARAAGMGDLLPRPGASGDLAGLIHRDFESKPVPYDRVDALVSRIDVGLARLSDELGQQSPPAARTLMVLVESCAALAPHVDDPAGVYADSLGRAVQMLEAAIDWWPAEADDGIRLLELLWEITVRSAGSGGAPTAMVHSALSGLQRLACRGFFPGRPAERCEGGPGTIAACIAVLKGILEMGSDGFEEFRFRLDALTAIAVEAGRGDVWRRSLGGLAGRYWRDERIQGALIEAAALLDKGETKTGETRSLSQHRRGSETE